MATVKFDVVAKVGESKDGKPKWLKCGVILETTKGFRLKLDAVPVAWDGWFALYEPQSRDDSKPAAPAKPTATPDLNDDIPF